MACRGLPWPAGSTNHWGSSCANWVATNLLIDPLQFDNWVLHHDICWSQFYRVCCGLEYLLCIRKCCINFLCTSSHVMVLCVILTLLHKHMSCDVMV